jgi:hypothetical protein
VLEAVSHLVVIMSNIRGLKVQNEERDCSFKDFRGHHFPTFNGSFSPMEVEKLAKRHRKALNGHQLYQKAKDLV